MKDLTKKLFAFATGIALAGALASLALHHTPREQLIPRMTPATRRYLEQTHGGAPAAEPHNTTPTTKGTTTTDSKPTSTTPEGEAAPPGEAPPTEPPQTGGGSAKGETSGAESGHGHGESTHSGGHSSGGHHAHEISDGGKIILFTFVTLLLGAILKEIKKKTNIPYTPMILIIGLLAGLNAEHLGIIGESVKLVNAIDPHTLLMIFIPGLIFEGAYNTHGYVFSKSKWQVLIMAGPGVLITSFILAYAFVYLFGYAGHLTVSEALVIGSIISTTDPVAVVALLKELGASTKFKTILEGESLLNDGTAFVFFLVCLDIVVNGTFELVPSIIKFFRLSFGGPLFGILSGIICTYWIQKIMKDHSLIVLITFVTTYLVFFVSENYLQVSGILALVSLGVYLSSNCKVNLSHDNDHAVHTVWGFCGFSLETLIFLITGTFIGEKLLNYDELALGASDIWKSVLFYPFLTLVRYVVMLIQLPFLNLVGYEISCVSAIILTYGGLRGAIALSLAMIVAVDGRLNKELRDICLFYVVTTIAFTVCINGLTIKSVMWFTGFLQKDPIKEKVKFNVIRQLLVNTLSHEISMKQKDDNLGADWGKVEELARLKNYKILEKLAKENSGHGAGGHGQHQHLETEVLDLNHDDLPANGSEIGTEGKRENGGGILITPRPVLTHGADKTKKSSGGIIGSSHSHTNSKKSNNKDNSHHGGGFSIREGLKLLRNQTFLASRQQGDIDDDAASEDINKIIEDPFNNINPKDVKRELRSRVYILLQHQIQEKQDHNICRPDIVRALKLLSHICGDHIEQPICLKQNADTFIGDYRSLKRLKSLSAFPLIGRLFLSSLGDKIFFKYQFVDTLIVSCHELVAQMRHISHSLDYKKEVEEVTEEIMMNIGELEGVKDSLIQQFPGLVNFIRTKMAAYNIVEYQRREIQHFVHDGLISEANSGDWENKLDAKIAKINAFQPKYSDFFVEVTAFSFFLLEFPIFSGLAEKEVTFLRDNCYQQVHQRGSKLFFWAVLSVFLVFD